MKTEEEIRQAIAIQAMKSMLIYGAQTEHGGKSFHPDAVATYAVRQADALITALNKKGE